MVLKKPNGNCIVTQLQKTLIEVCWLLGFLWEYTFVPSILWQLAFFLFSCFSLIKGLPYAGLINLLWLTNSPPPPTPPPRFHEDLLMLGKSKTYYPRWWFNDDVPWYKVKNNLKQIQAIETEQKTLLYL